MDNGSKWVEKAIDRHEKQLAYLSKGFHELTGALKFVKWLLAFICASNILQHLKDFL